MDLNNKLQLAYHKIKTAHRILIVGHIFPDADALASMGVMIRISQDLGKEIYAYAEHKPILSYDFIPNTKQISRQMPANINHFSLIIILDCGSISRTNLAEKLKEMLAKPKNSRPYIIDFDHHV